MNIKNEFQRFRVFFFNFSHHH